MKKKKMYGQFFTITNPFSLIPFAEWINETDITEQDVFLEPFAGANNIIKMIEGVGLANNWACYDLYPNNEENQTNYRIIKRDTIKNFPKKYKIAITNPPYLARNSATRSKLKFPTTKYGDLYQEALDKMLQNVPYVAAIIPESFITNVIFKERLAYVISLTCKMFYDTECPVCLALFSPSDEKERYQLAQDDFWVYNMNEKINKYQTILKELKKTTKNINWRFNDPQGNIGLKGVDNTSESSIKFIKGSGINASRIKISSRSLTRISGLPKEYDLKEFLIRVNINLNTYRHNTGDVFLTSFKSLRKDKRYRRRLDFATARYLMNLTIAEMESVKK